MDEEEKFITTLIPHIKIYIKHSMELLQDGALYENNISGGVTCEK
jgi:hypothetical protein